MEKSDQIDVWCKNEWLGQVDEGEVVVLESML